MYKKIVIVSAVLLLLAAVVYSQEKPASQWWLDKPIFSIKFEGLNHADPEVLRGITNKYLGKNYTNELFAAMQNELFDTQFFAYFSAQAERGGDSGEDLVIIFTFVELPVIEELLITGYSNLDEADILDVITIGKDSFATSAKIKESEAAIRELYLSKGFTSVEVVSSIESNTDENTITLEVTITEGLQSKIAEILFEGNQQFSDNTLRRVISSRKQSLFNQGNYIEATIEEDKSAIRTYYQERGYVDAVVTDVIITDFDEENADTSKNKLSITFVIAEGEAWSFGGIEINGNAVISDEELSSVITHRVGRPLNTILIQQNISEIAKLYWNDGYVASNVNTEEQRNYDDNSISYTITIVEGNQSTVEDVIITGQERTKDFVLYRELVINPGDIFSIDKLFSSMQNIYNTGIIEDVTYDILYGTDEDSVVVQLTVLESNKVDLEFGATFGGTDDFPVSGFFSWTDKNFLGNGQDFSISLNISPSAQTLNFSFQESWLLNQRWNGGISLSAGHFNKTNILQDATGIIFDKDDYLDGTAAPDPYNSYEEYQNAISSGLTIPESSLMSYDQYQFALGLTTGYTFHTEAGRISLGGNTSISLSMIQYDDSLYRPYNPLIRGNLNTWQFTNKVGLTVSWDGRDLIENTTTGFLIQDSISYAGGILGGTSNFIKNSLNLAAYATIFEIPNEDNPIKGVLAISSSLAHILPQYYNNEGTWEWGIGATQADKLYIDGMNIARGSDTVYNLEFLWDNMIELSVPIAEKILWGEIYASATGYKSNLEDVSSLNASDFYFGTGAGIRLAIPGFPLGLYLTKNFYFDDSLNFHWVPGEILADPADSESGFKLVLAITTTLY